MSKSKRGFASMDAEKQRMIASKGGKAAHAKGTAHEFTPEEARAAGRKGGQAAHRRGTAHQFTPEEAREAGRKGGQSAHGADQAGMGGEGIARPQSNGDELRAHPQAGMTEHTHSHGAEECGTCPPDQAEDRTMQARPRAGTEVGPAL